MSAICGRDAAWRFSRSAIAEALSASDRCRPWALVAPLGLSQEVADDLIESYAVVSAIGPTYSRFQFDEVFRLADAFGLRRQEARRAVAAMIKGPVTALLETDVPAADVMDLVPVKPLAGDEAAVRAILQERLRAVYQRPAS